MFKPKFFLTEEIGGHLKEIESCRLLLSDSFQIFPKEGIERQRRVLIRNIYSSVNLPQNELDDSGGDYEVDQIDELDSEDRNYLNVLTYIYEFIHKKRQITAETILELHKLSSFEAIAKGEPGSFRNDAVRLFRKKYSGGTLIGVAQTYIGPSPDEIPRLVDDLLIWLEKTKAENFSPAVIAGLALSELLCIHPFFDGNGRTARALATLILCERGCDFTRLFALRDYYNVDRDRYLKSLNGLGKNYADTRDADFTKWLEYFIASFAHFYVPLASLLIKKIARPSPISV